MQLFKTNEERIEKIKITRITPNKNQPRTIFDDDKLMELSESIKQFGIIQPIVVREMGKDEYEIIAGERRFRASLMAGLKEVDCVVRRMDEEESAEVAILENIQRENLTAIEEAVAYKKLIEIHGVTQEELATKLGKSQSSIANKLRLLRLTDDVKDAVLKRDITERHARAMLKVDEGKQKEVLDLIVDQEFNVKQAEEYIKASTEKPKKKTMASGFTKDIRIAINTFKQAIKMVEKVGTSTEVTETDHDEYYEFKIRIKKS
jgi:ParB family chromosome partitioning protein